MHRLGNKIRRKRQRPEILKKRKVERKKQEKLHKEMEKHVDKFLEENKDIIEALQSAEIKITIGDKKFSFIKEFGEEEE